MAVLNAKQRKRTATVVVAGQPKYPIPDAAHARAALARINQAKPPLTAAQKAKVRAKAHAMLGPMPSGPHKMPDGTMMRGRKGGRP